MLKSFFDRNNMKKYITSRIIASFSISLFYLLSIYFTCGMWFETNDDVFIAELLSGKLTGAPEYHCTFVSPIVTYPLSFLYSLSANIPWWGILIWGILLFSLFISLFSIMFQSENITKFICGILMTLGISTACIHIFGQSQFTSAAMILAIAGYIVLFGLKNNKYSLIIFIFCELLSCAVRDSSMMIIQPMGFCFIVGYILFENFTHKNKSFKKDCKYIFTYFISVILIICITKFASFSSFSSEKWHTYLNFNTARVYLFDYQEQISYENLSDILMKYNISQTDYEQYLNYRNWYPEIFISDEFVSELLPRLEDLRNDVSTNSSCIFGFFQLIFSSNQFWHIHQLTAILFLLTILLSILYKKYYFLIPSIFTIGGYLLGIFFLSYRNKYALRVMIPYYYGALLFSILLLWTLLFHKTKNSKNVSSKTQLFAIALTLSVILIPSFYIGKNQFAYIRRQNHLVNTNNYVDLKEIMDYCNSHPENHYITDMSYERLISTDIFCSDFYSPSNFIYSGSWYSCAPSMVNHGKEYIGDNDLFYLVYEGQEIKGLDGAEFYASKMCSDLVEYDTFKLSGGATIHVYRIANNSELK